MGAILEHRVARLDPYRHGSFLAPEGGGEKVVVAFALIKNCKLYGPDRRDDIASAISLP